MAPNLKDFFNEITYGKDDTRFTDGEIEQYYSPYVITKMLSTDYDLVMLADLLNHMNLDNKTHYLFLMNMLPKKRLRMPPFPRKEKNDDLEVIMEYYGLSDTKALDYLSILTPNQIEVLRDQLNNGGRE
jgi:hypothetical protein